MPRHTSFLPFVRGSLRSYSTPAGAALPVDLARVQSGLNVRLRDYEKQKALKRFSYDLKVDTDGVVQPSPGPNFTGPNGCSLREPSSPTFQEVVRNFHGSNITIFVLKQGTPLPETLTLLHEHSDLFSLQCTKPMKLNGAHFSSCSYFDGLIPKIAYLNKELTEFFRAHARVLDKEQFDEEHPFSV